jgi:hypothetical protein
MVGQRAATRPPDSQTTAIGRANTKKHQQERTCRWHATLLTPRTQGSELLYPEASDQRSPGPSLLLKTRNMGARIRSAYGPGPSRRTAAPARAPGMPCDRCVQRQGAIYDAAYPLQWSAPKPPPPSPTGFQDTCATRRPAGTAAWRGGGRASPLARPADARGDFSHGRGRVAPPHCRSRQLGLGPRRRAPVGWQACGGGCSLLARRTCLAAEPQARSRRCDLSTPEAA